MFHKTSPFLIVFLFFPIVFTHAQIRSPRQPAEISGQLRYSAGGAPAADVVVRLDQLAGGFVNEVRTDRLGKFKLTNLSPIQYQVIIRHPGYKEISREVNLVMQSSEYLQLQLVAESTSNAVDKFIAVGVINVNVPPEARKEYEQGESLTQAGDSKKTTEAIKHFERAIEIAPAYLEAKLKLGTAYMDLGDWSKAEKVLVAATQAHTEEPSLLFALGELFLQQKKTKEAEEALSKGLNLEPRSWQGHYTLGRLYWNGGDIVKAARQVAIALQLNPNFAEAHLLAGNIFLRARKNADAQVEFEEYLRLAPHGKYVRETKAILEEFKKAGAKPPKN
jgi:tetratricopeptide (TPR) repeat protein